MLKENIKTLFYKDEQRYGDRRIHALLKKSNINVSEKVFLRIMRENDLIVKMKKSKKYNSDKGEIIPAVEISSREISKQISQMRKCLQISQTFRSMQERSTY